jgi:hypothetical protein
MTNANSSDASSKDITVSEAPEKSQRLAIGLSLIVLGLWLIGLGYSEEFVGPVVSVFEWFELRLGLDVLPGNQS